MFGRVEVESWLRVEASLGDDEHVVDVDCDLMEHLVLEDDVLHNVLEERAGLVDAHGNAVPFEDAKGGREGCERLGGFSEVELPISASEVER